MKTAYAVSIATRCVFSIVRNAGTQVVVAQAPQFADFLDDESAAHFAGLCERLDAAGQAYTLNPAAGAWPGLLRADGIRVDH